MSIFEEEITERQSVKFILDDSESLSLINDIDFSKYQKSIVFCDEKLKNSIWHKVERKISDLIIIKHVSFLQASEETKSIDNYSLLVGELEEHKCSRDDLIIVIGGGTILDAISYLSSTYMRGIDLCMIPTTLIGQADASTAGKTCINTNYGKNVLGTLFLPKYVYNNVSFLSSISKYELRQGFSEIFKYGLLGSKHLINLMEKYQSSPTNELMLEILRETINVRISIRKKDPLASNLGHTFGHALEKISKYEVNHGDAISVGILMALMFSHEEGLVSEKLKDNIASLINNFGLNSKIESGVDPELLTKIMLTDKKSSNSEIRLVLIEDIGIPLKQSGSLFYPVKPNRMKSFLETFLCQEDLNAENHWEELRNAN